MLIPIVVEQTPRGERAYDIYSRLLKDRIVCNRSGFRGCGFTSNPPAIPARSTAGGRRAGVNSAPVNAYLFS